MRPHLVDYLPTHEMSDRASRVEILMQILLKIMEMDVLYTDGREPICKWEYIR